MTLYSVAALSIGFVAFTLIYFTARPAWRRSLLIAASLLFYWLIGSWVHLLTLLLTSFLGYFFAIRIASTEDPSARKRRMQAGIVLLAGNLVVLKCAGLLNDHVREGIVHAGSGLFWFAPVDLLPIGISFFTFQLIAYVTDVYHGMPAEQKPTAFLAFVAFFPKIVSGPIERARHFLPQLHDLAAFSRSAAIEGTQLIIWGAFKKVVVADHLGMFVDRVYDDPQVYNGPAVVLATGLYAFQIYFDFSGYADIAIGAARVLGYRLTPNFNRPYCAISIQDFWKRWHISFTSWLTDYVYAQLLRQRIVRIKLYYLMLVSIILTFLVSGLWHGVRWNFVIWGLLHGSYLVASVLLLKPWSTFANRVGLLQRPSLHKGLKMGSTFTLVCFGYLFFRGNSVADSLIMVSHLGTGWSNLGATFSLIIGFDPWAFALGILGTIAIMVYEARPITGRLLWVASFACAVAVLLVCALHGVNRPFIYYQF